MTYAEQVMLDITQKVLAKHPPKQYSEEQIANMAKLGISGEWFRKKLERAGVPKVIIRAFADSGLFGY